MRYRSLYYIVPALVFLAIIIFYTLVSANSDLVVDVHEKGEYAVVATKSPIVKDEFGFVDAKRADGWSGLILDENIRLTLDDEEPYCVPSGDGNNFFLSKRLHRGEYRCVFEVYQKTSDSFDSVKKFVSSKGLRLYTNDYSRGVIWIPASCKSGVKECQIDLDFLRDKKMIWEREKGVEGIK